eukprot:Colp12_sorted_trinity150504_noHs@22353
MMAGFSVKAIVVAATLLLCAVATVASVTDQADDEVSLQYYAKVASWAYCPTSTLQDGQADLYKRYNMTLIKVLSNPALHVQGFVIANHAKKEILYAFRGTVMTDVVNWASDIDIRTIKPAFNLVPRDALVHNGFYSNYMSVHDQVHDAFMIASRDYPYKHVIVGHSLGGAMATLCAIDLFSKYEVQLKLYTYASPRVMNPVLADWINGIFVHRRVVNQIDIVPKLPTEIMGFKHIAQEIWIQPDGSLVWCNMSGEDPKCSASAGVFSNATCQLMGETKDKSNCHGVYMNMTMSEVGCF